MVTGTDFVGRGIGFPLSVDHRGGLTLMSGDDAVEASIVVILSTARGERVMRPEFGCAIWEQLFDPVNHNTLGLMAESVRQALARWEPRIDVEQVTAGPAPDDHGRVEIEIEYRIRDTNERRNLVYPFYVIAEEAS